MPLLTVPNACGICYQRTSALASSVSLESLHHNRSCLAPMGKEVQLSIRLRAAEGFSYTVPAWYDGLCDQRTFMPTVLRTGPYRFFFYAGDRDEPPHIHIEREGQVAKFWLDPIRLQESGGFSRPEIGRLQQLVIKHQNALREAWDAYFGS